MKAGFINTGIGKDPDGYDIHETRVEEHWYGDKTIYQFNLNPVHPLTFIHPDGHQYQPCRDYETDQGSVPKCVQRWIPKDRFLGYYLHDCMYLYGYLWMLFPDGSWGRKYVDRKDADELLRVMLKYDPFPATTAEEYAVYLGVRLGGWASWARTIPPESQPPMKYAISLS